MMKRLLPLLASLALAAILHAPAKAQLTPRQDPANLAGERVSPQDPADTLPLNHGAPALQQLLAKLRTRASLMLIVAHPDDEDGGLLTYESRGQGARVAMLTLTRGEGGQNLMSADFDDALGLIRTQELLAADRFFGVDQFFGTEVDFGFSKTKEESFQKWTHDRVLYDAVRAVRLYRPLVIASVFVGGPTDGHGQHQVAGEIAQEVFVAAADPTVFPEMIAEGLLPWAPLKVYARVPFSRVTPEGMFDYATGRTVPTRFHNYVTGEDSTAVPTATVLIHEGDKPTDPTLAAAMGGDTFLQFARKGLALQKTQIGPNARLAPAGAFDAGYTLIASRLDCIGTKAGCPTFATASSSLRWASPKPTPEQSLFDGIDTSLSGLATLVPDAPPTLRAELGAIDKKIAEVQQRFDSNHLEAAVPPLEDALRSVNALIATVEATIVKSPQKQSVLHELRIKQVQTNDALVLALGLSISGEVNPWIENGHSGTLVPGSIFDASGKILSPQVTPNIMAKARLQLSATPSILSIAPMNDLKTNEKIGSAFEWAFQEVLPLTARPTKPYFTKSGPEQAFYALEDPKLRNAPMTPPALTLLVDALLDDLPIHMTAVVESSHLFPPALPALRDAVAVLPVLSVSLTPTRGIVHMGNENFVIRESVANNRSKVQPDTPTPLNVSVGLDVPFNRDWKFAPRQNDFTFAGTSDEKSFSFALSASNLAAGTTYQITGMARTEAQSYTESFRPVGYPGIPYTNFYTPATTRITAVDLHTAPNLHIAYLPGTGDPIPDFLPNLGITPTLLTLNDLTPATLNQYDAILLGVRAYAAHPELAGPGSQPLLDYAKQGGIVILQYNTARFGDAEAPFPLDVPGDPAHNVVEEAQPVTLLHPDAPLLTWPNRITPADFDNWVAERGHGFAATWSPQYQPLLETHDVGQDPQQGGLLLARTGKGAYIYCALALYRQLPEGVPGAYRLLANLLSYAHNPAFAKQPSTSVAPSPRRQ